MRGFRPHLLPQADVTVRQAKVVHIKNVREFLPLHFEPHFNGLTPEKAETEVKEKAESTRVTFCHVNLRTIGDL